MTLSCENSAESVISDGLSPMECEVQVRCAGFVYVADGGRRGRQSG